MHQLHGTIQTQRLCPIDDKELSNTSLGASDTPNHGNENEWTLHVNAHPDPHQEKLRASEHRKKMNIRNLMTSNSCHDHSLLKKGESLTELPEAIVEKPQDVQSDIQEQSSPHLNREMVLELFEHLQEFKVLANAPDIVTPPSRPFVHERIRHTAQEVEDNRQGARRKTQSCGHLEFYTS